MQRMWEGNNLWKGNRNPVTLVAAVVMRNVAVQPLDCFADRSAKTTTKPARIPTRLNATWNRVNTARPVLMRCLLNWNLLALIPQRRGTDPCDPSDTRHGSGLNSA